MLPGSSTSPGGAADRAESPAASAASAAPATPAAAHAPPFERIVFDCDSTLSRIEGIEELSKARPAAVVAEIAELTAQAMDGRVPLEEVYGRRLQLVAPRRN